MWWADGSRRLAFLTVFFILFIFSTGPLMAAQGSAAPGATTSGSTAPSGPPRPPGAETIPPKGPYILLNIAATSLFYYEDGRLVKRYQVGVGRTFEQTPVGDFKVVTKQVNPTWYPKGRKPVPPGPANPLGTRWMGLGGTDYGIHGTNAPWSLGYPSSGGCIRLLNADAEELFARVKVGTPVKIIYETVEVTRDDKTGEDTLIVWADIYKHSRVTPEEILDKLGEVGRMRGVRIDDLLEELAGAGGRTLRLPLGRPAELNGWAIPGGYHEEDGSFWVFIRPLAEGFGHEVNWDGKERVAKVDGRAVPGVVGSSGRWRVRVEDLQGVLGVPFTWSLDEAGRLVLSTYGLYLGDSLLTRQLAVSGDDFLFPLRVANSDLGLRGWWDFPTAQVTAGGEYLPGAIHDYEPYILLGPLAAKLGYQVIRDDAGLRLILVKEH